MVDRAVKYHNEGSNFFNLGRYTESLTSYDKAIAINPDESVTWNDRGLALLELRRPAEALVSFNKAIAINPNDVDAWCNRADSLYILGQHAEALVSCDKAIELDSKYGLAWNNKGDSLKGLKRYEEAIAAYDRAIQLDPQNESAIAGKIELLTKIHNEQQNNEKEAIARKIETPPQIVYNVVGNVHVGDSTQTDIKNDGVIQRSTLGAETPMGKTVCPRCQRKIHDEKFCPDCGQNIR